MLFSHGFGCDQNMWRLITPAFQAEHRVVLFDYVGCGKSDVRADDPQRYATPEGYAKGMKDARAASFSAHLAKPVSLEQLGGRLARVATGTLAQETVPPWG